MPILTLIGKGCLNDLGSNLKNYGVKKALIVTDTFMCKSGVSSKISEILKAQGIESAVYDGVKANPTIRVVNEGINSFLENECDSLISLGGGSAHDSAKAVRISLMQGGLSKLSRIVLAAVNTTAGTASEMTKYCIITDEEQPQVCYCECFCSAGYRGGRSGVNGWHASVVDGSDWDGCPYACCRGIYR